MKTIKTTTTYKEIAYRHYSNFFNKENKNILNLSIYNGESYLNYLSKKDQEFILNNKGKEKIIIYSDDSTLKSFIEAPFSFVLANEIIKVYKDTVDKQLIAINPHQIKSIMFNQTGTCITYLNNQKKITTYIDKNEVDAIEMLMYNNVKFKIEKEININEIIVEQKQTFKEKMNYEFEMQNEELERLMKEEFEEIYEIV